MVRPGMTEGTSADAAPETVRTDFNPGTNVGASELGRSPTPGTSERPSQDALDEAQAEARREASPASYQAPEKVNKGDSMSGILLMGGAAVIVALALLYFLR